MCCDRVGHGHVRLSGVHEIRRRPAGRLLRAGRRTAVLRHLRRRRLLQQLERHGHRQLGCDVKRVPVQCSRLDTCVVTTWVDVRLITCRLSSSVPAAVCSWVAVQPVICRPRCSRLDSCVFYTLLDGSSAQHLSFSVFSIALHPVLHAFPTALLFS